MLPASSPLRSAIATGPVLLIATPAAAKKTLPDVVATEIDLRASNSRAAMFVDTEEQAAMIEAVLYEAAGALVLMGITVERVGVKLTGKIPSYSR